MCTRVCVCKRVAAEAALQKRRRSPGLYCVRVRVMGCLLSPPDRMKAVLSNHRQRFETAITMHDLAFSLANFDDVDENGRTVAPDDRLRGESVL